MPATVATLTWATPVKVDTLAVNLEAYFNLLPTLNTFRLCQRYGRGPHAAITRLPDELFLSIKQYLVEDERLRVLDRLMPDYRCFLQLCAPLEHLDEAEAEKIYLIVREGFPPGWEGDEKTIDLEIHKYLINNSHEWTERHSKQVEQWEDRILCVDYMNRHSDEATIRGHFGLDVWISPIRHNGYSRKRYHPDIMKTTIAYIKLPGGPETEHVWSCHEAEGTADAFFNSGFGMGTGIPRLLTQSARARFERMMKILDLEPLVSDGQEDSGPSENCELLDASVETAGTWPQLTILVRSRTLHFWAYRAVEEYMYNRI